MLKTITSNRNKSLIYYKQNSNNSGIFAGNLGGELCLKQFYVEFFRMLEHELEQTRHVSFVRLWKNCLNEVIDHIRTFLIKNLNDNEVAFEISQIDLVVNKFRGNVAEILVEKLSMSGHLNKWIGYGTYVPVEDPHNEGYVDGLAKNSTNGLRIGVQVKNYDFVKVSRETFDKLIVDFHNFFWNPKNVDLSNVDLLKQLAISPKGIILSFTDAQSDLLLEQFSNDIIFIGPKQIDSLCLQGSKDMKCGQSLLFKEIANEIREVN